jgi:prolyl-tRNA editing enzyme YbaK/EbsC (Cys-tRNA(Pro) deacylase)
LERVSVSAGLRGLMIQLAPTDYLQAVQGQVGTIGQCDRTAP